MMSLSCKLLEMVDAAAVVVAVVVVMPADFGLVQIDESQSCCCCLDEQRTSCSWII